MRIIPILFLFILLGKPSVYSQEIKEYDDVFEQQLLNVLLPGEQNIKTGEYLLTVSKTDFQKAQAYFLMAQGQNKLGQIEKSIENLFLAKKLSDQESNNFLGCYAEILLSRYCVNYGIFDKSKNYLEDAKKRVNSIQDNQEKAIIQSLILEEEARTKSSEGNFSDAFSMLKKQEEICNNAKLPEVFLVHNKNMLGYCFLKTNQLDSAAVYLNHNLQILKQNSISANCTSKYVSYGLACVYLIKNDSRSKVFLENLKQEMTCKPNSEMLWVKELQAILVQKNNQVLASFYENKINDLEVQDIENRRIGRSVMLSQIEQEGDTSSIIAKVLSTKGILILSGVLVLLISLYIYNSIRYKREYEQFKRIMSESDSVKKVFVPEETSSMQALSDEDKTDDELGMNQKSKAAILERLDQFERMELYLSSDMSLEKLSKYADANSKYVREIIQKYKSKNYSSYINELRVNHVIHLLKNDPEYLKYKVSYLAEISGFSSHSAFSVVFRSIAGLSPNQFIEFLKKEKKEKLRKSS